MDFLSKQWRRFWNWWQSLWDQPYKTVMVEELPDKLAPKILYVAGENGHVWFAAMICPCGCGETLQMGLLKDTRPSWVVETDVQGRPSLSPSVWRKVGCRSHFLLKCGRINWCDAGPYSK